MDNKPSFSERIARLKSCAYELHNIGQDGSIDMDLISAAADIMLSEAQSMEAAAKRFQERRFLRAPRANTKAGR
jgi:hypothetical protein